VELIKGGPTQIMPKADASSGALKKPIDNFPCVFFQLVL